MADMQARPERGHSGPAERLLEHGEPTSKVGTEPQVQRALERASKMAAVLEDEVSTLIERLDPVLNPGRDPRPEEPDAREESAPIADAIDTLASRLERIRRGVSEAHGRLEV